jgi:hypothetical protein
MNSILPTATCIAVLGLLLTAGANVAVAAGKQSAANSHECFTDDGYGRKRSCAASQYRQKQADKNPFECFTDDGYGRKRSCSDKFKR